MIYARFKLYNPTFEKDYPDDAFRVYCYNLYQLDWLLEHGHLLDDVLVSLIGHVKESDPDDLPENILNEWPGPQAQIYASFWEFCENEYRDEDYMRSLLNATDYNLYVKDKLNFD